MNTEREQNEMGKETWWRRQGIISTKWQCFFFFFQKAHCVMGYMGNLLSVLFHKKDFNLRYSPPLSE